MSLSSLCHTLFHWPDGIVVGNLIASMLWVPLQWLGIHLRLRSHAAATHARLDAQDAVLANQAEMLTSIKVVLAELQRRDDTS